METYIAYYIYMGKLVAGYDYQLLPGPKRPTFLS